MTEQAITLKTVNELRLDGEGKPQRYFIAAYQRGYRWTPLQVTQLPKVKNAIRVVFERIRSTFSAGHQLEQ